MVHIKRENKRKVYEYLLNEGVIVVKKDMNLPAHADTGVKNLEVWMLLRSMKDRDLVDLVFSWQYFYFYLKNEGVKYLRDSLGIAEEVIPATFKKTDKLYEELVDEGPSRPRGRGRGLGRGRGDRSDRPAGERGYGRGGNRKPEGAEGAEGEKAQEGEAQEQQQE